MYIFIINPTAGNGRAKKIFSKLEKSRYYKETDTSCYYTDYEGHAEEIAKQIVTKDSPITTIIVIGGDGTLHEVINGIGKSDIPVSFIPGGSGNDFARGSSIKGSPDEIFGRIVERKYKLPYWLGRYKMDNEPERFFVNSMGFGFDAAIARTANKSTYKRLFNILRIGTANYVVALMESLIKFKPMELELIMDGEVRSLSNCLMVTIANHPYYGGGMKMIPSARIQPSSFSVIVVHSISKWKVLGLFLTIFSGKHTVFKEVEILTGTNLKITSNKKMMYQVDGQTDTCRTCEISKESEAIYVVGTD